MSNLQIFKRQTFGQQLGYGERAALLVIDFQEGFTREDGLGGYNINAAIESTAILLSPARSSRIPIAHVRFVAQDGGFDIGTFGQKVPRLRQVTAHSQSAQFVPSVAPRAGEYVSEKRHSSAFFGTNLAAWLMSLRVDTLFVAGCTTSGCVRASVVDASAYGLRPMVVKECVGDRAREPHDASLFDMEQKYADIVSLDDAMSHIKSIATS